MAEQPRDRNSDPAITSTSSDGSRSNHGVDKRRSLSIGHSQSASEPLVHSLVFHKLVGSCSVTEPMHVLE